MSQNYEVDALQTAEPSVSGRDRFSTLLTALSPFVSNAKGATVFQHLE
jgi:hypothetical protein